VIYAEGNIRIRGMLPKDTQLTVVSNQNIYIEGNLLKYRDPKAAVDDTDPWRGTDGTTTCGLALLARQSICVNTTQFLSPLNSISADNLDSEAGDGTPPFAVKIGNDPDSELRCAFDFGPWESETATAKPESWYLFLRHAGEYEGASYINAWLNPSSTVADWGILALNIPPYPTDPANGFPPHVWGVGDPRFNPSGWGVGSAFACDVWILNGDLNASQLLTTPGLINLFQIGLDQTTFTRNNYLMGGLAVQPMDIRIEAILYAQEGSFFVIPGRWFNPNPSDTRPDPADTNPNPRPAGVGDMFPYYGDALDVRIVIDGAVSENIPAAISDVQDWMSKWGRIPDTYGSGGEKTAHPGEGFAILYDDHAGWPFADLRSTAVPTQPIRADKFGRPLPIAPRLPVSRSLIYMGDVM
jgi:hypothetical protein